MSDEAPPPGVAATALRVVQWTTGNVARKTVPALLERPDLELVGCFAWSPDKVGVDVATLVGLDEPCGVTASDDVAALLALRPDCVLYTPLYFDVDEVVPLLRAGVNVATSAEFLTGHGLRPGARSELQEAAEAGGVSLFGTGMNPGYAQLLAGVATGLCSHVRHVRMTESVDVSLFAADKNMDHLGWGRAVDDPTHADDLRAATVVFEDAVRMLAGMFDLELDEPGGVVAHVGVGAAPADLDLPGRPIAAGTVAGIDLRYVGVAGGREVIELHQRWVMSSELDPPMPAAHGYTIQVDGSPQVTLTLALMPDQPLESLTVDDMHGIGMTITGMPVVNAIRHVVAARPGIVTYADLPVPTAAVRP